ncbi:hypothetical protein R1sor_014768 [Riccia sorocarpa]|uniref:Uncharacterized protein n=1 Tax=Riccia sorocarpa TaxID=122646 RepID=A0ABD3HGH0_9MARC
MQSSKSHGGVQILPLVDQSAAVKIRQVTKILEWDQMKESATLQQLLKPWYKVRDNLRFDPELAELPANLTIHQVLVIAVKNSKLNVSSEVELRRSLKRLRIYYFRDLKQLETRNQVGVGPSPTLDLVRLSNWARRIQMVLSTPLQRCKGWKWQSADDSLVRTGWSHETKWWKRLLSAEKSLTDKMNRRWGVEDKRRGVEESVETYLAETGSTTRELLVMANPVARVLVR